MSPGRTIGIKDLHSACDTKFWELVRAKQAIAKALGMMQMDPDCSRTTVQKIREHLTEVRFSEHLGDVGTQPGRYATSRKINSTVRLVWGYIRQARKRSSEFESDQSYDNLWGAYQALMDAEQNFLVLLEMINEELSNQL